MDLVALAPDLTIVAVVALCTLLTRALPFWLFGRGGSQPPAFILYIGKVLPPAVMAVLVVYCLRGSSFASLAGFAPQAVAVVAVVLLHLWRGNDLLSIAGGTAIYMVLVRLL